MKKGVQNILRLIGFLLLLLPATFCSSNPPPATPYGPNVSARRAANMAELAARETGCSEKELVYHYVAGNRHKMVGCGKEAEFALWCPTMCIWVSLAELRKRAAFDLSCPAAELTVHELDMNTWGAKGCKKTGTYLITTQGVNVIFVLNSIMRADGTTDSVKGVEIPKRTAPPPPAPTAAPPPPAYQPPTYR